jgi:hypothetical protein
VLFIYNLAILVTCCAADDEAGQKKKKKIKTGGLNAVLAPKKPSFVDNVHRGKKMNKTQPSGSYTPKENSIRDSKEVIIHSTLTMLFIVLKPAFSLASSLPVCCHIY